ncbi:MAG: SDR family oxidoreductase [Pseudomonadota bacterium]|jgi:citronellol/citronellal dehydrogenase|nr:SDR family oxidoreductase [Pseudomonadota bacterium]MEC8819988.1 SDR family oxidoreductase [Pseudomonadota bacterium]
MHYRSGFRPGLFDQQSIFIPGGGGGLGRCIAHELSSLGAQVILAGRSIEKLEKVRDEITQDGGRVAGIYTGELRDEQTVIDLIKRILDSHGRVHGLVNAAGGQFPAKLKDLSLNGWNAVIENNLTSYFLLSREIYRQCFEKHGGSIVHLGADYENGMPGMGHNGAARAGLSNLTFTSSVEWAASGVRVNCVIPGFIGTTGLDRYPESAWQGLKNVVRKAPINRHGTAAEISAAVVFLMSEMAAFITGIDLRVDGGIHHGRGGFLFKAKAGSSPPAFNGFHRDETAELLKD